MMDLLASDYSNLLLTRKVGETVQIGSVYVTVKRARNGSVQLCIRAPRSVRILRSELLEPVVDDTPQDPPF